MTKEQYDKSIETGELQLTFGQKFNYYGASTFMFSIFLIVMIFTIADYLNKRPIDSDLTQLLIAIIPLILGILVLRVQKLRLKFTVFTIEVIKTQLLINLIKLCEGLNWAYMYDNENAFIAKTNSESLFGDMGEQVTIILKGNTVFVNSIKNPNGRPLVISNQKNAENLKAISELINTNKDYKF
jgi:hypothetical protein